MPTPTPTPEQEAANEALAEFIKANGMATALSDMAVAYDIFAAEHDAVHLHDRATTYRLAAHDLRTLAMCYIQGVR